MSVVGPRAGEQRPRSAPIRVWRHIAPLAVFVLTLAQLHVPRWLGWEASKASFEATAAELVHNPGKAQGFEGKIGAYQVRGAAVDPKSGAVYFLTTHGLLDTAAFVRLPEGARTTSAHATPLDGDWKVCTNDLNGES